LPAVDHLLQDVRFALRQLRKTTLIGGRHFTEQDDAAHLKVAIINRALAQQ
jgi:hypothetical protein